MSDRIVLAGKQHVLESMIPLVITTNLLLTELRLFNESKITRPRFRGHPQITLHFRTLKEQHQQGIKPGKGEISFRVMEATINDLSLTELKLYADRINQKFANPPFVWKKGKVMVPYGDLDRGIDLRILAKNLAEGRRVIDQVCEVLGVPFEAEFLGNNSAASPELRYPENPGKEIILGESVDKPVYRPEVDVTFRYATVNLGGKTAKPIVDLTGKLGLLAV